MKTKLFLLQLCRSVILIILISFWGIPRLDAQTNEWTWVSGSNTTGTASVYGTKGIGTASTVPGARDGASGGAASIGYFWIFGGGDGTVNYYNDLWTYVPGSGIWTWVAGNNTFNGVGVYGTRGIAAIGNVPGARSMAAGWTDPSDNIWIFGGYGYDVNGNLGQLNDLWEFNISTYLWTWVSGNNTINMQGVYGTQGVAAAGNVPGSRYYHSGWVDAAGNFWIFGGDGFAASGGGFLNDLWEFNPSTEFWTWVSGSSSPNPPGSFGTQGVAAASNMPSGRFLRANSGVADPSGNFWVFGGRSVSGLMNDLWEFNPLTGLWTWVSGSSSPNSLGVYGTQGVAASSNVPGARGTNIWTDASGNIWTFGGGGFDIAGTDAELNDLWEYNVLTGQWMWVNGSTTVSSAGSYGIKGTASGSNQPPNRQSYSSWADTHGNFWVMGGISTTAATYNDLWEFSPLEVLALQTLTLHGVAKNNENILTWQTTNELNTTQFVLQRSTDGTSFSDIDSVAAIGSGSTSYSYTDALPPVSGNVFYRLKAEDRTGNVTWSSIVELTRTGNIHTSIFPNPAVSGVTLQIDGNGLLNTPAKLLNAEGKVLGEQIITGPQQYFDLQRLPGGIYFLQLADGTAIKILKP